ncbi:MAG: phosphotransferase [Lachnospiraceae bacterium]|nr:phosphotransferase [Lachnospiraceae bacterium]
MSGIEINNLMESLKLGAVINEPVQVTGGLLHKMYRVNTNKGAYAVKVLNAEIMKRPVAFQNTVNSEKIAAGFQAIIPVVSALEIGGRQIQEWNGTHYMIFDWVEGASVFPPMITSENCYAIGDILGKIHQEKLAVDGMAPDEDGATMFNWDKYGQQLPEYIAEDWANRFQEALPDIKAWNQAACEAGEILAKTMVISHRDLDPKNVMWNGDSPLIIDWEAAGYVNPYQELLEVINYWADDGKGGLLKENFDALLYAYTQHVELENVDWDPVFAGSFYGMLGWLEYNMKRALGIENGSTDDAQVGKEQVLGTIGALYDYQKKVQMMKQWLE